jgi:hypothetical protein
MKLATSKLKIAMACSLALALAACKTTQTQNDGSGGADKVLPGATPATATALASEDPNTSLPLRSALRWNLIIEGKPELAYDYLSPGYKSTRERDDYANRIRNRPVKWTKIAYVDHDCGSEDACSVKLNIDFKLNMPQVGEVESTDVLIEQWVKSDGQWYFLPDERK